MQNNTPRLPGGKKKTFPMFLRIICTVVFCTGVGLLALYLLLHNHNYKLFQTANSASEYLTAQEFSVNANNTPAISAPASAFATEEPEPSATSDRIEISQYATLQLGDDNSDVADLQQRLMELGYMESDEPGTLYNESTQNAVILFQRATNSEMTGIAYAELQSVLFSDSAQEYLVKMNDDGSDVKGIQRRLSSLGYYTDRITGYFGPQTEQAVMLFQSMNQLHVNGQISRADWELLYSDEVVELSSPTPTASPTPTPKPTSRPTVSPTGKPSTAPTSRPTGVVTVKPTSTPPHTAAPTDTPFGSESPVVTAEPSNPVSTETPVITPEVSPSDHPTESATVAPTDGPETPTPKPTPKQGDDGSYGHSASELIRCAEAQIGDPYILGDEGPGSFDCSGLVYYCLRKCGFSVGRLNAYSYSNKESWKRIDSYEDLKKGDLIFFKSDTSSKVNHAAIYAGGGRFIHASASRGEVLYSSFGPYWYRNFVCGRRIF